MVKKYSGSHGGRQGASVTVEACIAFTTFAVIMLTILFLIRIVFVYELVQHQINMAAKELASYSYIYDAVGAMDIDDTIQSNASAAGGYFNEHVGNIVDGVDSIISLGETAYDTGSSAADMDIDGIISGAEQTGERYADLKEKYPDSLNSFKTLISNPKKLLKTVGSIFLGGAAHDVKAYLGGEVVRAMMSSYLEDMNRSGGTSYAPQDRMEKLGVVGGLSGIDFSQSSFNETVNGQEHCIDIIACYKVKPVSPISIYKELGFMNRVTVKMWVGN